MTTYSFFATPTPASPDVSGGTAPGISTGTMFGFNVAGMPAPKITHIRFRMPNTPGAGNYFGELWDVKSADAAPSGNIRVGVTSPVAAGSLTAGAWNTIPLTSPVTVLGYGTNIYRAVINSSGGRYVAEALYFAPGTAIDNGPIRAYRAGNDPIGLGSVRQGTFLDATAGNVYPNATFNNTNYFVDVVLDDGSSGAHAGAPDSIVMMM